MTAKGHMLLASSAALGSYCALQKNIVGSSFDIQAPYSIYAYISIIIGSLFPDIDEEHSYIGNKLKPISIVISSLVKHRTLTHYLLLPLLLIVFGFYLENYTYKIIIYGFAIGMLLHDAGDMLTKGGIRGFFFPLFSSKKIVLLPDILRFRTFSMQEYIFIIFALIPLNIFFYLCIVGWIA